MMINPAANAGSEVPSAIVDALKASIDNTYSSFFSEKPSPTVNGHGHYDSPCIAGIISFLGETSWSLSWILTKETAPLLARKFAGFEIPFDRPDMGDVAGELVNVLGGEIVAQLEKRQVKTQMSLPTIALGSPLELLPENDTAYVHLKYASKEGTFWFRLASAKDRSTNMPGK